MKKSKSLNLILILALLIPGFAFAQLSGVADIIISVGALVRLLVPILAGIALLVFIWGLVKFIFRLGGSEEAVKEGKKLMIWGLIALFVMVSVWGIIAFVNQELNLPAGEQFNQFLDPASPSPNPSPNPSPSPCQPPLCGEV